MATIASTLIDSVCSNGGSFITMSSVYNVHQATIGQNKKSNVYIDVLNAFRTTKATKIWAKVGAKGRSQHSASEVLLFDASNMTQKQIEDADMEYRGTWFDRSDFKKELN